MQPGRTPNNRTDIWLHGTRHTGHRLSDCLTDQSGQSCELSLNHHGKPTHSCVTKHTAPPWLYIPEHKQTAAAFHPLILDWHACWLWDVHGFFFYLTLAFVEPQHTASEHRHGRGHGGGVKGGGFMDCGCWPPRSRLNDGCSWWSVKLFSVANSFFPFFFFSGRTDGTEMKER